LGGSDAPSSRKALQREDIEVVAVNEITDARTLAHLLEPGQGAFAPRSG
jgi:glyceraldehyde-3-phosphate dehydrogenase/erythrose-4-phosphate dehydrogenase